MRTDMLSIHALRTLRGVARTLVAVGLLQTAPSAFADAPLWGNARNVKATLTDCGSRRTLTLEGHGVETALLPDSPGCKSSKRTYVQVNVAKAFLQPTGTGRISEPNVDAGTILCSNGDALVILGRAKAIERAIRQHPAPRGCSFSMTSYQQVSSVGNIPFSDVANGGTMSVKESLDRHAKERARAISVCNASAACRAEVARRQAIDAYHECLKPTEFAHTCTRPW